MWLANTTATKNRNLRTRNGMLLCMQDYQIGQIMIVLPSAEKTRLTHFILLKKISSKLPSLTADGNTIMNLP
jgi:hypothetical protein